MSRALTTTRRIIRGKNKGKHLSGLKPTDMKIYTDYFVFKKGIAEISKSRAITPLYISKALKRVTEELPKIPPQTIIDGTIASTRERIKEIRIAWQKELNKKNVRGLAELNKELREDEKWLFDLERLSGVSEKKGSTVSVHFEKTFKREDFM